jgi:hypothetical protein
MIIHRVVLAIFMVLMGVLLSGCKDRVPLANTPGYYKLHGIVNDGQTVNEITLFNDRNDNRPKLRFPAGVGVDVNTPGTHGPNPTSIRKGFAYSAAVWLDLTDVLKLKPVPHDNASNSVSITFHASLGPEDVQKAEAGLNEIARLSVRTTEKPEWGLREYVLITPKTDSISGYHYVPTDESSRPTNDGVRMSIGCRPEAAKLTNNIGPSSCAASFNFPGGMAVSYMFSPKLLPYWREIYQEVIKFTDSILVK